MTAWRRLRARLRRAALPLLLAASLTVSMRVPAQALASPEVTEGRVKAAYLYKFGSYVDWPSEAFAGDDAPLQIGIVDAGNGTLAEALSRMVVGRNVQGRPLQVRVLKPGDSLAGLNVVFIGHAHNPRLAEVLAAARHQPILTVTEADNGLALGAMINFVVADGRVRFEVAPRAALQSRLSISARLLAAAHKVEAAAP